MKQKTEKLAVKTGGRVEFVDITPQVEEVLQESHIKDGICLVSVLHTTAGVYINENEQGLTKDIKEALETLVPKDKNYKHDKLGEGNAHAHIKSTLLGKRIAVGVSGAKLDLGTWEHIMLAEFDGPRSRNVLVKILGV